MYKEKTDIEEMIRAIQGIDRHLKLLKKDSIEWRTAESNRRYLVNWITKAGDLTKLIQLDLLIPPYSE